MYFGVALLWNGKLGQFHYGFPVSASLLYRSVSLLHFSTNVFFHPIPTSSSELLPPVFTFNISLRLGSDRAAEFDISRTGIEPLGDRMRLPQSVEIRESEDLIYFTAEIAIRRLMNRIIGSLYAPENVDIALLADSAPTPGNTSLNQLLALSSELDRQLDQYCATIPIHPSIAVDPASNDRRRRLNLRVLSARHLIHRLFVFYVALQPTATATQQTASPSLQTTSSSSRSPTPHQTHRRRRHVPPNSVQPPPPPSPLPPMPRLLLDRCHVCIQSSEAYIRSALDILGSPAPHLWTVSQSCLASFVVLFLAGRSAHLRHLAPDLEALAGAFAAKLRKWTTPGSSLEALLGILDQLVASGRR